MVHVHSISCVFALLCQIVSSRPLGLSPDIEILTPSLHPLFFFDNRTFIRCTDLRNRIRTIEDGDYALAKRDVDALRSELDEPPLPSLQQVLEEKSQQYVRFLLPSLAYLGSYLSLPLSYLGSYLSRRDLTPSACTPPSSVTHAPN